MSSKSISRDSSLFSRRRLLQAGVAAGSAATAAWLLAGNRSNTLSTRSRPGAASANTAVAAGVDQAWGFYQLADTWLDT